MSNRTLVRNAVGLVVLMAAISACLASCSSRAEENKKGITTVSPSTAGNTTSVYVVHDKKEAEEMKAMLQTERFRKIDAQWSQIHKAGAYEKAKDYKQAEIEYKKAIELAPEKIDETVPRAALADIYEATGQYEKAIEQLDWLIKGKPRKDVLDELLTRKQSLEKLLAEQTANQPNQT